MLQNYLKAFKAYDIRGLYEQEIDVKFAFILGKAVGKHLIQKHEHPSFLLASDVRNQNTALISHFLGGMQTAGAIEVTIAALPPKLDSFPYGICSTPTLYYLAQYDVDLAVSVTASHNP
jgi:phosphomannomutase